MQRTRILPPLSGQSFDAHRLCRGATRMEPPPLLGTRATSVRHARARRRCALQTPPRLPCNVRPSQT
ncbi:uncharacterized protein B0H18DRAFT_992673, partial [Fomitopsis serialis]|uniref:uncharacterized protein n=1 Tax=Fomitopsis serialis TaxID=139415 RepID=UPI002008D30E